MNRIFLALSLVLAACGEDDRRIVKDGGQGGADATLDSGASPDGGLPDATSLDGALPDALFPDATTTDATSPDSAFTDATTTDGTIPDAATTDGMIRDTSFPDGTTTDATMTDGMIVDAAFPDATTTDGMIVDTAFLDATTNDATMIDAAFLDATVPDLGNVDSGVADSGTFDSGTGCQVVTSVVQVNVETAAVSGTFTTNGAAPGCPEYGRLYLEDQITNAQVTLINDTCPSTTPIGSFNLQVPVGTYNAYFASTSCGPTIPCSSRVLIQPSIQITQATTLTLDATTVALTGTFTTNGQSPGCPEYGRLKMTDLTTGAEVTLINDTCPSTTPVGTFNLQVPAGAYDVYFSSVSCGPTIPCSSRTTILANVAITQAMALTIDATTVTVDGTFTTNGAAPGCPEYGRLKMTDKATGAEVTLINDTCPSTTPVGSFNLTTVPIGTYDIFFSSVSCGPSIPCSSRTIIQPNVSITGATTLPLNATTVTVDGTFTTNGATPGCPEYGRLKLVDQTTAAEVTLVNDTCPSATPVGTFNVTTVPAGTYDAIFSSVSCGPTIPCSSRALIHPNLLINASTTLNLDATTVMVSGTFTTNGSSPGCPEYGRLKMTDRTTGAEVTLINDTCPSATPVGTFNVTTVPTSTYDIHFTSVSCGPTIPCATKMSIRSSVAITQATNLTLDAITVPITGNFTTNGQPPGCPEYGRLFLQDRATSGEATLINDTCPNTTPIGTFNVTVPASTYDAYFSVNSCGPTIPCSARYWIDCLTIQ